mmetsp:Transcript_5604/g.12603  ORF Transcript_5604/g.12603 Transcript_5604/m.12603 type:complete len:80 (+) Transcript_5604:1294-1533(+)
MQMQTMRLLARRLQERRKAQPHLPRMMLTPTMPTQPTNISSSCSHNKTYENKKKKPSSQGGKKAWKMKIGAAPYFTLER